MARARFLVCEKTGRWAAALRREAAARPLRVFETRSLAEGRRELERSPASFLALELTRANVASLLAWIEQVGREFPAARTAVLGQREAREFEWWVREFGAIDATFSPRQVGSIVRQARRHIAAVPEPELSFRDAIWQRLPWPKVGSLRQN